MSGAGYTVDDIRDELKQFVDEVSEAIQKRKEEKRLLEAKKKEVMSSIEKINDSRKRMTAQVMSRVDEKDRKLCEEYSRTIETARNELDRLKIEYDEALKEINETENRARCEVGEESQKLYKLLNQLEQKRVEMHTRMEELDRKIEADEEAIKEITARVNDEFVTNQKLLIDNIHDKAYAIVSDIKRNINSDAYCDFAMTVALSRIDALLKEEKDVADYQRMNDRLDVIRRWVTENSQKIALNIRSERYIEDIVKNLSENLKDDPSVKRMEVTGNYTSMVTVVIEFPDCISTIKILPDGQGAFKMLAVNVTPGIDDKATHDELCSHYSAVIADAAKIAYNPGTQTLTDAEIRDAEELSRKSTEERHKESDEALRNRLRMKA